jgi:hypothetical protein
MGAPQARTTKCGNDLLWTSLSLFHSCAPANRKRPRAKESMLEARLYSSSRFRSGFSAGEYLTCGTAKVQHEPKSAQGQVLERFGVRTPRDLQVECHKHADECSNALCHGTDLDEKDRHRDQSQLADTNQCLPPVVLTCIAIVPECMHVCCGGEGWVLVGWGMSGGGALG